MKNARKIALTVVSAVTVGAAAIALSPLASKGFSSFVKAAEVENKLTINKMSARTATTLTATTEQGNTVDFSYSRFDTRPGTTDYNNCIAFYKVLDGVGGYIKNNTSLYSVKTIKIYSYTKENPEPTTLATNPFNIYYGYEQINVGVSNSAKVEINTGTYTFADGYEPSFIAIETLTSFDLCVSKIEITYKCEPVVGTSTTVESQAYKYQAGNHKEFTYANGNKVDYDVEERAPWAHYPLEKLSLVKSGHSNNTTHEPIVTRDSNGVSLTGYYNSMLKAEVVSESYKRNILSITLKGTQISWGTCFYMHAYSGATEILPTTQIYNNAANGTSKWIASGGKILDAAGNPVLNINSTDFFTYEIDLTEKLASISATATITEVQVWSGYSDSDVASDYAHVPTLTVKDLTFKATACGHAESQVETQVSETAHEYKAAGTYHVCSECGEVRSLTDVTKQAPWFNVPATPSGSSYAKTVDGDYTLTGKSGSLYYMIPSYVQGTRTELAITVSTSTSSYEAFYLSAEGAANFGSQYQFFTPHSSTMNYSKCSFVKAILDETNVNLYDSTALTNVTRTATSKVTYIFDLTDAKCAGITRLKISGVGASVSSTFRVDLREPTSLDMYGVQYTGGAWDNWAPDKCTKKDFANFTCNAVEGSAGVCTLGNFGTTYKAKNFPDSLSSRMVRRLKFKMVKDLDNPTAAGVMQWYFLFSGGTGTTITLGNASTAFAQKSDMHVLDMNGNLVEDGTKLSPNTYYFLELLFDADNMPSHIQIRPEGCTGDNPWGYSHFIVEDFNVAMTVAGSSFAA